MNKEEYEEFQRQQQIMIEHDCDANPDECGVLHPLACKIGSYKPMTKVTDQYFPDKWRRWLMAPKVAVQYYDKHEMTGKSFNLSEAFEQMCTKQKVEVIVQQFLYLLDSEEKSLFLATILRPTNRESIGDENES